MHKIDEDTVSLLDFVQFIKASYKKVLPLAFCGLLASIAFTYAVGQFTASITLLVLSDA